MNFADESGLNTGINEQNPTAGRGGFGLAQWTGDRRVNLENYAAEKGRDVSDPNTQLDFFMHENQGSEAQAWAKVLAAPTDKDAAVSFVNNWERPAPEHAAERTAKYGGTYVAPDTAYSAQTEIAQPVNPSYSNTPRVEDADLPKSPGLWQMEKDAFQNTTLAFILNSNPNNKVDPNWAPTVDKLDADLKLANLDPERYAHFMAGSTSEAGYNYQLEQAKADRDRLERLSRSGMTGAVLDFVNQALDPVNLAIDAGVSLVAPEITAAKYGVRVSRMMSAALAGSASGLATSAARYAYDPNGSAADVMMGAVVGGGMGAIVGRLLSHPATAAEGAAAQKLTKDTLSDHVGQPRPAVNNKGSAGAAAVDKPKSFLREDADGMHMLEHGDVARNALSWMDGGLSARIDGSKNPAARLLGSIFMPAPVGKLLGRLGAAINGRAASEEKRLLNDEFQAKFHTVYRPQAQEWIERTKGSKVEFNKQVFKYVNDKRTTRADHYAKEVKVAGDNWIDITKEQLKLHKNALEREGGTATAVDGAAKTNESDHYIPTEWDAYGIHMGHEHFGEQVMDDLFLGAFRAANPLADEADLKVISDAFRNSIRTRGAGVDNHDFLARISGDDMEDAMAALVDHGSLSQKQSDEILKNLQAKRDSVASDAGRPSYLKHKALIAKDYPLPYKPVVNGVEHPGELNISDFLNMNTEYLASKYIDRGAGSIAMARAKMVLNLGADEEGKATHAIIKDGFKSKKDFIDFLDGDLRRKGVASGQTPAELAADRKRLLYAYETITGTKRYDMDSTTAGWALRMIRKFNFTRMMNQVGLAQLPELGNIVGSLGLKSSIQQMPSLRRVINAEGRSVFKSDTLGNDMEATFGAGLEHWRHYTANEHHDNMLDMIKGTEGGTWDQKLSAVLDKGSRLTSKISGMEGIDMLSRRWAFKSIVQKFAHVADGRGKISVKRLADLGLDKEMSERVFAQLRDRNIVARNGTKVVGMKLDKWADKEAAEAFRRAVYRKADEVIQRNDIGAMYMWMGHPIAKTLMQFRTFMVGSLAKQTLKGLHMRDWEAARNAGLAMTIGAMVYELQVREQAIGRSDKKKFLADRLKTDKIIGAGFAKAGVSSVLPMLVDTVIPRLGYKPQFSYNRTTGQASDLLLGNPASGLYDDIGGAINASRGIFSGNMSQEEARTATKILPFNNAFVAMQGYNYGISGLTQRTPQSRKKLVGLFGD
jgi:hypothetical protein